MGFFLSFIFYTSKSLGQQKKKMWIHLLRYFFLLYLFYHIEIQNGSAFTWWISGVFQVFFRPFSGDFQSFFCSFFVFFSFFFVRKALFYKDLYFFVENCRFWLHMKIFSFISYNTILTWWWCTFQLPFSVLFAYLLIKTILFLYILLLSNMITSGELYRWIEGWIFKIFPLDLLEN